MDNGVIRISNFEDEKVIGLLKRMLDLKKQENKDVECELNGRLLTTLNSENLSELLVNNSSSIFMAVEEDRKNLLEIPEMQKIINNFENRGVDEFDTPEEATMINKLEDEFDIKLKELSTLDYSKPANIYEWLNSIVDYVNNDKLYIPLDRQDYKYGSTTNYIVQKLKEKGYTTESNQVNNLDDYFRRLISYQLSDLDKYGFFAYDYVDKMVDNHEISEDNENIEDIRNEESKKLKELEAEKDKILFRISVIDDYEKGLINRKREKTVAFDERIKQLQLKIVQLEKTKLADEQSNIKEEFSKADNKLKELISRTNSYHIKAVKLYETADAIPFPDNIITALEEASSLPDNSVLKQPLIDALIKMDATYVSFKNEKSTKLMQETMDRLGIKPYNPFSSINDQIMSLEKEIKNIENTQNMRIGAQKPIREKLNSQLKQVETQIQEITYYNKLSSLAKEEPIFVDTERRVDERNQWMEFNTAKSLNKISSEEEIPTVQKDSMTIPHPIKAIKKASQSLLKKVNDINFKNVKKNALDWIKEHKKISLAVAMGLMMISSCKLKTNIDDANLIKAKAMQIETTQTDFNEEQQLEEITDNKEKITDNVTIEKSMSNLDSELVKEENSKTKTASEITQEAIQNTINGVLNGDEVYSNKYDVINNQNGFSTSQRQKENSWANAEVGVFYDNEANVLTREEAEEVIANGGEVVARFDNNNTPIGYSSVGQLTNDNTSKLSK